MNELNGHSLTLAYKDLMVYGSIFTVGNRKSK